MDGLDTLSGIEFEGLITRLFDLMGFLTETTKASGDGGIDIVATLDQPFTGGRYLIQCKRYAPDSPVGAATVREFYGALTADRMAVKGILITTSSFTAQALEFAENLPIELIARNKLERLLARYELVVDATGTQEATADELRPEEAAKRLLGYATKLREQGKDGEAIKVLRAATHLQPGDAELWLWLGICNGHVGLHDDEVAALREAVRLRPDYGLAWYFLGCGLWSQGEMNDAIDALIHAADISPDDDNVWVVLGEIYWNKSDKEQAFLAWERAAALKPDCAAARRGLGRVHFSKKEYQKAISAFLDALRIDPNDAEAWDLIAITYLEAGDRPRMIQALARLDRLDPAKAREFQRAFLGE